MTQLAVSMYVFNIVLCDVACNQLSLILPRVKFNKLTTEVHFGDVTHKLDSISLF